MRLRPLHVLSILISALCLTSCSAAPPKVSVLPVIPDDRKDGCPAPSLPLVWNSTAALARLVIMDDALAKCGDKLITDWRAGQP